MFVEAVVSTIENGTTLNDSLDLPDNFAGATFNRFRRRGFRAVAKNFCSDYGDGGRL
jgi:hypothetical protein